MGEFFDLPTLFFLVVAVVVLLRLRSVLGTRDGFERPDRPDEDRKERNDQDDNVVQLPKREGMAAPAELNEEKRKLKLEAEVERYAKGDAELADGLNKLIAADPRFSPKSFMDGAIAAYEMVVVAFAEGDRKTLKMILDKSVYDDFEAAIIEREAQNQKVDFTFVGLSKVELKSAEFDGKNEVITVEYNAEVVSATRDADGNIIDGDSEAVVDIADEWTFARPVKSRDPNWKLVSTNQLS